VEESEELAEDEGIREGFNPGMVMEGRRGLPLSEADGVAELLALATGAPD